MFVELNNMLNESDLQIIIKKKDGQLTVSVMPRNLQSDGKLKIQPIMITGTPEELDANFLTMINAPILTHVRESNNIARFEKDAKDAADAKSKADKDKKNAGKPAATVPVVPPKPIVPDLFSTEASVSSKVVVSDKSPISPVIDDIDPGDSSDDYDEEDEESVIEPEMQEA